VHNRLWTGLVDLAGVMWLQRRCLHGRPAPDGRLARLGDALGVYWLRRRPCAALPEEELG
jgi:hypothetical protein